MTGIAHGRRHWLQLYHRRRWLHRWHRTIGALVAGFLVYLVATGLPLQFSNELSLGSRHVDQDWILDWYGIQAPTRVVESAGISSVANIAFRDGLAIGSLEGFRGAIWFDGLSLIAGENGILLYDPQSNAVLDRFAQPEGILRIGTLDGTPVVQTPSGIVQSDPELVNWQRVDADPARVTWSSIAEASDANTIALRALVRKQLLPVERLFQDLHSGRFFGTIGVILIDISSIFLLFLAFTGVVLWWRRAGHRH
jgi:PepSY-associated TM region